MASSPTAAEFWTRVAALGARPAPNSTWAGPLAPVQLICRAGHRCAPRPIDLKEGQGLCPVCARRSPRSAEAKFLARVAAFDAQLAPGARYVNAHTPVQLICQQGHQCAPRPVSLKQGQRPCLACNRSDSRKAV